MRAMGSGGWAGGAHADTTQIGTRAQYMPAVTKGYVIVTSDHGHSLLNNGSFAMNPDGSINTVLWQRSRCMTTCGYSSPVMKRSAHRSRRQG